jgi:hypothetical protein
MVDHGWEEYAASPTAVRMEEGAEVTIKDEPGDFNLEPDAESTGENQEWFRDFAEMVENESQTVTNDCHGDPERWAGDVVRIGFQFVILSVERQLGVTKRLNELC